MLIDINKNKIIITDAVADKEVYSTKIIDESEYPTDIDEFAYIYNEDTTEIIKFKPYNELDKTNKELQESISSLIEKNTLLDNSIVSLTADDGIMNDYLLDIDYRLVLLELGGVE